MSEKKFTNSQANNERKDEEYKQGKDIIPQITLKVNELQSENKRFDLGKGELNASQLSQNAYTFACGLKKIVNIITEPQNIDQIQHCEQIASVLAWTDEVLLKSLVYRGTKDDELKWNTEHDLEKLFNSLPQDQKAGIYTEYNKNIVKDIPFDEFEQSLHQIKDTFVDFRYCYEFNGFALHLHFIKMFTEALFEYCDRIYSAYGRIGSDNKSFKAYCKRNAAAGALFEKSKENLY